MNYSIKMDPYLFSLIKSVNSECSITVDAIQDFEVFFRDVVFAGLPSIKLTEECVDSLFSQDYVQLQDVNVNNFSEISALKSIMKDDYIESEISSMDYSILLSRDDEGIKRFQWYIENYFRNFIRLYISKYGTSIDQNNLWLLIRFTERQTNIISIDEEDDIFNNFIKRVCRNRKISKKALNFISLILRNLALMIGVKNHESFFCVIVKNEIFKYSQEGERTIFDASSFLSRYLPSLENVEKISALVEYVCEELIGEGSEKISLESVKRRINEDSDLLYMCRFLGIKLKKFEISD